MYKKLEAGIVYIPEIGVNLKFDAIEFSGLVSFCTEGIRSKLNAFKEKMEDMDKRKFVQSIGVAMEVIQTAITLHVVSRNDIKIDKDQKSEIKSLVLEINELVHELGQSDTDFCTDYETQRVCTTDEMLDFINKKW